MQLNVLDDLAEAMKALEEKSTVDPPKGNGLGQKKGCVLFSEAANYFCWQFGCFWNLCKQCVWREVGNGDDLFLKRWWIHHQWIHQQHDEDVFRPSLLFVAKAKQLKQKKFKNSMLHVHRQLTCFLVFPVWKKDLRVCSHSHRVLGNSFLYARRGVNPFDARRKRARLVVIRSCWIFAW